MALSSDETYVQTYQKYLKHKGSSEDLRKVTSSQTASTKVLKPVLADKDCKICRVLAKPGDLCRVLNQGLYHKYTSSQDYFYTRDINTLLSKKRKAFSVRYYDDLIYDECKERLKGFFKKKDSVSLMHEIKQFYTKFKNFPRNFQSSFFHIINSNIRKHRRLEYMRVFHGANLDDDKNPEENQADQRDNSKNGKLDKDFNLMELLGDSFVQENYRDVSNFAINGVLTDKPINTARSIKEIEENFKALWKAPETIVNDPNSAAFSNALYNKNYMLYSRSDSQNAEDILKQIVNEFKEADIGNKASMSLAEKVLYQVASATTNLRKQENRASPALNQRTESGSGFEFTPLLQASKKSLGATSTANFHVQPQPMVRQPSSSNINTSNRVQSNPRTNSRGEVDSANILGKANQSKLYEQRKSTEKFSVEHLNDIVINRNKIMSSLYQFRSTRSKSGGLKSIGSTSKTPSHKGGFPLGVIGDVVDPQDFRQPHAPVHYIHEKSTSPSPDRRISTGDSRHIPEMIARPKPNIEISTQSTMKRSASQGLNGEIREVTSPMIAQVTQVIQHKKANSVMKKRVTATPIRQNPAMQTFTMHTMGNSSSIHNMSNSHQDTTVSPNHGKFINPLRSSLGGTQQYYFRHQSPMDEKMTQLSGVYQKGVNGASEPLIKNLNIRGMKHTSPNRTDNNYRTNTLSMSGRHQTLLDASGQLNKTNPDQMKVKKIEKANMQAFAAKIIKRASLAPNNIITPVLEQHEQEIKQPKKILELSDSNYNGFKELKMSSKEHTPMNIGPSSTSSLNKYKVDMKKNTWSSYNLKAGARESNLRLTIKK